jgi:N-carbamoyl-L-amino-acid hydrolase
MIDVAVCFRRLRDRLDELGEVGALEGGGVSRLALTDADRDGRDLVVSWLRDLGTRVEVDRIGNITGTWPADGFEPAVLIGSHIDSVHAGGRYDGTLGVLAGIEVLETLMTARIETRRPVAVTSFTDEEGSRFPPDMLGSLVAVGGMPLEEALDLTASDGAVLGDGLARIGYAGASPCPAAVPPAAYLELHVEQGPLLEHAGVPIGAVTGVQGISWTEVTIGGQSNHAGTTPMDLRHDAGYAAASIATYVRTMCDGLGPSQRGTVGRLDLRPNLVNVVPGSAVVTVDLRNTDERVLGEAEGLLAAYCKELAAVEGVAITTRSLARYEPVQFDTDIVALVESVSAQLDLASMRLASGAGHDAQMLARVCPAGMIFVPSAGGVSHNPAEHTDDVYLEAGANVLLGCVLQLAEAVVA